LLTLIIKGDLNDVGAMNYIFARSDYFEFGFFTGVYTDYDILWYENVGAALTFTMCLFVVGEQPLTYFLYFRSLFNKVWDKRWSFNNENISHCTSQEDLNELSRGEQLEIETKYAAILTLIFVCMTYSAAMPFFNVIVCANLGIIYTTEKYMMLRYYRKPAVVSRALPLLVVNVLFVCALIHVAQGIWMLGANVYRDPRSAVITKYFYDAYGFLFVSHSWHNPIVFAERVNNPNIFFLLILFAFLGFIFVMNFVFQFTHALRFNQFFRFYVPKKIVLEGNTSYIKSLTAKTLVSRLATGTLTEVMREKYVTRCYELDIDPYDHTHDFYDDVTSSKAASPKKSSAAGTMTGVEGMDERYAMKKNEHCCGVGHHCCHPCANTVAPCANTCANTCAPKIGTDEVDEKREMLGHESYNMNTNEEYRLKFGLHSDHMRRMLPQDWIVQSASIGEVDPELSQEMQDRMDRIIEECQPKRNSFNKLISPRWFC
jgi:hypothetical protein